MISRTTERFRKLYDQLPLHIKRKAKVTYQLFKQIPYHPSLRFKKFIRKGSFSQFVSVLIIGLLEFVNVRKSPGFGSAHTKIIPSFFLDNN